MREVVCLAENESSRSNTLSNETILLLQNSFNILPKGNTKTYIPPKILLKVLLYNFNREKTDFTADYFLERMNGWQFRFAVFFNHSSSASCCIPPRVSRRPGVFWFVGGSICIYIARLRLHAYLTRLISRINMTLW